ncbi:MAG: LysM peptidoglycan-binding domain-containing protein [Treponema sp.]|nr:LysM peptidoglycan-binding domain-containing protein [Treponema sp.]
MKSIGIKLADGSFYPIIKEGSEETKTLDVTTVKDNQTTVQIDLYSSESDSMADAQYVDSLEITHLNPHPNGEPNLHLEVSLDKDNKLRANVIDPETGLSSTTKVTLVSRSEAERSNPANFSIGDQDTVSQMADNTNKEDFNFDGLSTESSPLEATVSDDFVSDEQVFAPDNMMADAPMTDDDLFISPEFPEADEISKEDVSDEIKNTDDIIVDNDGTKFSFNDETTVEADDEPEVEEPFEGITADNFVTIEGTTGENGFELPEDIDTIMPPDPTTEESATEETVSDDDIAPDSITDDFPEDEESEGAFDLDADNFLTIDGSEHTGENGFEVPPELISSDLYDDPANPPKEEMPPEDMGTEDLSIRNVSLDEAEPETKYDLPDFDDIKTDTSNVSIDVTVPQTDDAVTESTQEEQEKTVAEEAADFDVDEPSEPVVPVIHQTNLTEDLPDFGEVDLTTNDDIDLPDFDDLPEPPQSTVDAIRDELPDFESPWETPAQPVTKSTSLPDFELPDFDDSPALRDDSSFQISSTTADDSAFGDDFFDDADTNYKKEKDREKFEEETEQGKGKNKRYALICIICTLLCLIIFGLFLFIFPTKLNLLKKGSQTQIASTSTEKTVSTSETNTSSTSTQTETVVPNRTDDKTDTSKDSSADKTGTLQSTPPENKDESQNKKPAQAESIAGKEDTIVVATTPSAVVPTRPEKNINAPAAIRYQVVWGDTLWDISNAYYKNPWRYPRIAEYNSIKNPDFILSGQILLIPSE